MTDDPFEFIYQGIERRGELAWGGVKTIAQFTQFPLRPFLEQWLREFQTQDLRALELGCGSGAVSLYLSQQGVQALGVDRSATAIAMAHQMQDRLRTTAQFVCADIGELALDLNNFGLIIDSFCLHCMTSDSSRRAVLLDLQSRLSSGGQLIVQSMVRKPEVKFDDNWRLDDDGVLWWRSPKGHQWQAQRLIRWPQQLEQELAQGGWRILSSRRFAKPSSRPDLLRVICSL